MLSSNDDLNVIFDPLQMSHSAFMKPFLMTLRAFLNQEDGNECTQKALKFMGIFIASYGEEMTESGASHPVLETSFNELLSVSLKKLFVIKKMNK